MTALVLAWSPAEHRGPILAAGCVAMLVPVVIGVPLGVGHLASRDPRR